MKAASPTGLGCACGCVWGAVLCGDPAPPRTAWAIQGARPERSLGLWSRKKLKDQYPTHWTRTADKSSPADCQLCVFLEFLGKTAAQTSCQHAARPPLGHTTGPDCCPQAPSPSSKYRARSLNWPSSGQQGQSLATWQHTHTDLCRDSVGTMQVTLPETYHHQINR